MKKLLLYGLVATTLFAASASVSLYWLPTKPTAAKSGETGAAHSAADSGTKAADAEPADKLRPLVKPSTPDTEQTALLFQALRDREKAVKQKEEMAGERRKMLEMVYQEIRAERAALDDLRKQIAEEMQEAERKLAEVDKKSGDLDKEKQAVSKKSSEWAKQLSDFDSSERKNVDKLAKVYESMAPESAARIIQQMADTNRLDTAVKMLSLMKERAAADILAQLGDVGLASQITDRLRGLKRGAAPTGTSTGAPSGQ